MKWVGAGARRGGPGTERDRNGTEATWPKVCSVAVVELDSDLRLGEGNHFSDVPSMSATFGDDFHRFAHRELIGEARVIVGSHVVGDDGVSVMKCR